MNIVRLSDHPELREQAAQWFHEKWHIPRKAYLDSIDDALRTQTGVPAWYLCLDGETIAAGMGVIENDFHDRPDLRPNVCAVYTESAYRGQRLAGQLLGTVCEDQRQHGQRVLYLLTDHTGLYERYGWEFYCLAQGDGEGRTSRMYRRILTQEEQR